MPEATGLNYSPANNGVPKIIWLLWHQGFENAPEVIQQCALSWSRHNPTWKVVLLNRHNLEEYVGVDELVGSNRQTISMQALSNIVRINLLARHGGLWVDATCFCCRSLDDWLGDCLASGFFAFSNPAPDRLISSWFLASRPDNSLTAAYCRAVNSYWDQNVFPFQNRWLSRQAIKRIGKVLNRNSRLAALWVHPKIARTLRLHPYHWFHYIFCRVITTDENSGQIWSRTRKISADIPHRLQLAGLTGPLASGLKKIIDDQTDPLYKLDWRHEKKDWPSGSVLDYLLGSRASTR
jgi:hypothetical protein